MARWLPGRLPDNAGVNYYILPLDALLSRPCLSAMQEGGARELSSARMHLRGVVRQAAERYGEHPLFADLQRLLADVEAAQERQQG